MTAARIAAVTVLASRIAYGAGLVAAPRQLGTPWLGAPAAGAPAQVPLRGLGAREVVVHGAALAAAVTDAPLRGWLTISIAGDLADIAATAAGRRELPSGALPKTAAVAGGSALISAAVAAAVEC